MCLIIVKPKDIELPCDSHISTAHRSNDDGIGVAVKFADKARVFIKKDFKDDTQFLKWMKENVKKEDTMIVHFRWATSGKTDAGNRHPFPITRNKELLRKTELWCGWAVAHNGVLSNYSGHKKYSDTQKFTMDILASQVIKDNLRDKTIQKMLEDYIGTDKLALLNEDGTLIRIGHYSKDTDGCYYSNETYKTQRVVYSHYGSSCDEYGWTGFGAAYHNRHNVDANRAAFSPSTEIEKSGTIFFDHCDGCGKKKKLLEVKSKHFDGEVFYLCKGCRKQYKKGKLDRLDEQLGEEAEAEESAIDDTRFIQCDGCLTKHPINEMAQTGQYHYCSQCCQDWVNLSKGNVNKLTADGGYCG